MYSNWKGGNSVIWETLPFSTLCWNIQKCNTHGLDRLYRVYWNWKLLPNNIKQSLTLGIYKSIIKNRNCSNYPCTLCTTFILNLRYLRSLIYQMLIEFMRHFIKLSNSIQLNIAYQINIAYTFHGCKFCEVY